MKINNLVKMRTSSIDDIGLVLDVQVRGSSPGVIVLWSNPQKIEWVLIDSLIDLSLIKRLQHEKR